MDLGLSEQQPTLAANSLAPIRPAYVTERCRLLLVFSPETSSDRRAENTDSDVPARSDDRSESPLRLVAWLTQRDHSQRTATYTISLD